MIESTASERTCIVQVELGYGEFCNLRQHRRNETALKRRVHDFIYLLYQTGFRHFIVFIIDPWIFGSRNFCISWRKTMKRHLCPICYILCRKKRN